MKIAFTDFIGASSPMGVSMSTVISDHFLPSISDFHLQLNSKFGYPANLCKVIMPFFEYQGQAIYVVDPLLRSAKLADPTRLTA